MVILFAANNYFEKGKPTRGFPIYLHRVTSALAEMGHTPIIVACGKTDKHYMDNGVEIHIVRSRCVDISIKEIAAGYGMLYRSRVINKKIKELLQTRNIDIIQFTSLSGLPILYCGKTPAVMRLSSYAKMCYVPDQTMSKYQVNLMAFFERLSAKHCNAVFAPCKNTADYFAKECGRKVSVIETPFINDVTKYDGKIYEDNLKDKKYVLFFGRMYAEKGILVIADILQRFLELHPGYCMVCCGQADTINGRNAVSILKEAAGKYQDRVIYLKALPHESLYPLIQHSDFVILPSLSENLSNACIEGMYFGKVVIGTDGASFEQLICDGENGLLCKLNDSQSLLEKMNEAALMSNEQKERMGMLAQKRIDKLRPKIVVKRLLKYYQYVINNIRRDFK